MIIILMSQNKYNDLLVSKCYSEHLEDGHNSNHLNGL